MDDSPKFVCPIPATHDKFSEAHYFLHRLMEDYHEPEAFRWNLSAFLQALRSVEYMLNSELNQRPGFAKWYAPWKQSLKQDSLIRNFVDGRNIVVHKGLLQHKSHVDAGLFRWTDMKLALNLPIDINIPSAIFLQHLITETYENSEKSHSFFSGLIDKEHYAIGEQLGIQRTWIVEELGDENVVILCNRAWAQVSRLVSEAHKFAGAEYPSVDENIEAHDITRLSILLESDLDPTLPDKWGW
jgi:hypothetical protein